MDVDASAPAAGGGDDSDDDWNPVVAPGVVLRPHVLEWKPSKDAAAKGSQASALARADPLHDAAADEEDLRWVEKELMQPDSENVRATAAVLNCPGCFTPVCYQCQRHTEHARQWRAVEVRNCSVDKATPLALGRGDTARYFAVRCEVCDADVGLLDDDGVYHLFHVLESLG
eukprot:TRINITY_DN65523_c0_g1_i1.p1 TRINITY_DN65523_c0_g1~~TRINITY_DN65523_c0_g1_i1.p1  ORF type:complete len:193 (-),score=48.84 TRINITY_DN65523_c0_g1_i1:101-616(-)